MPVTEITLVLILTYLFDSIPPHFSYDSKCAHMDQCQKLRCAIRHSFEPCESVFQCQGKLELSLTPNFLRSQCLMQELKWKLWLVGNSPMGGIFRSPWLLTFLHFTCRWNTPQAISSIMSSVFPLCYKIRVIFLNSSLIILLSKLKMSPCVSGDVSHWTTSCYT